MMRFLNSVDGEMWLGPGQMFTPGLTGENTARTMSGLLPSSPCPTMFLSWSGPLGKSFHSCLRPLSMTQGGCFTKEVLHAHAGGLVNPLPGI